MTTNTNELDGNIERMRGEMVGILMERLTPIGHTDEGTPLYSIDDVAEALGLPVEMCEAALERGRQARTVH